MSELPVLVTQPPLFDFAPTEPALAELFPAIWNAMESLVDTDVRVRLDALKYILSSKAALISPLVAYLVATRLADTSLEIRAGAIRILADVMGPSGGIASQDAVRKCVMRYLADMRTRQVFSLLMVTTQYPDTTDAIRRLLNSSPYAGTHLIDIASSRKAPIEIRKSALTLIGLVGYLDAQPALERMLTRLESRINGQQAMPFVQQHGSEDGDLLPELRSALALLRAA